MVEKYWWGSFKKIFDRREKFFIGSSWRSNQKDSFLIQKRNAATIRGIFRKTYNCEKHSWAKEERRETYWKESF